MSTFKLGHVHLKVRDLDRSVAFYTELFQMRITEEVPGHFVFLTGSDDHHQIALQNVGPDAPLAGRHHVGLYHTAFEVPDAAAFAAAYDKLTQMHVEMASVDHGISWGVYFNDPNGNGLEIYLDTRNRQDGSVDWHGQSQHLSESRIKGRLQNV